MQPQDQQNPGVPQPTPNPQPASPQPDPKQPPVTSTPPQGPALPPHEPADHTPAVPVGPAMSQSGLGQPPKKKPMALVIGLAAVGVLALAGIIFAVYMLFFNGIKLETYDSEGFSMQVPVDYEKEVSGDTVTFTEKGDEATASKVVAYYNKFPTPLTEEQLTTIKESFKSQLENLAKGLGTTENEVDQFDVKDATFQGKEAFELTAKFKKDGKDEGNVRLVAVITTTEIYVVGVAAHATDSGLDAKKNDIINSFKIK